MAVSPSTGNELVRVVSAKIHSPNAVLSSSLAQTMSTSPISAVDTRTLAVEEGQPTLRDQAARQANEFLAQQMLNWSTQHGCRRITQVEASYCSRNKHWKLTVQVDGKPWSAICTAPGIPFPIPRLHIDGTVACVKDVAFVFLAAAGISVQAPVQMLHRMFREVYEADAHGQIRLVRLLDREQDQAELETWP